jgi:pimeloyl-ACP methyl ester carboxylesterase
MERMLIDDVELHYQLHEGGERVVFVHASPFVSWYRPLIEQLAEFSTLSYRRHLRQRDGRYRPLTVADDAAICAQLLDRVGWPAAHVVGHSYGALVALQLAMGLPERVGSVALLEPAARGISSSDQVVAALRPVFEAYHAGDKAEAVDRFLRHVCGDGYRAVLEREIPGAFAEALDEADQFFQAEIPAVQQFTFGPSEAARITQPILNVLGSESVQRFVDGAELVQSWFLHAERLTVADAGHLLMVQNPTPLAQGLHDFITRHPIADVEHLASARLRCQRDPGRDHLDMV